MEKQIVDSYRKTKIETADQLSLILMLYDRAICLLKNAKEEISEKEYEKKELSLNKAQDIVLELLTSLDQDKGGAIATSLSQLYEYVIHEITEADLNLNIKALDNAERVLSELRKSWEDIKNNPNKEANDTNNTKVEVDLSG